MHHQAYEISQSYFGTEDVEFAVRMNTGDESGATAALNVFTQDAVDLILATDTAHCEYMQREPFWTRLRQGRTHVLHMLPPATGCEAWGAVDTWNEASPPLGEAMYLAGKTLAGTTPGPYCFVAPLNISLVTKMVNAFTLGARSERPSAAVEVVYINTWYSEQTADDEGCEARAAKWLLAHGCNGLASYTDSPVPQRVFSAAGKMSVGAKGDVARLTTPGATDVLVLTSAAFSWEVAYIRAIETLRNGTWVPRAVHRDSFATGAVALSALSPRVPRALAHRVLALVAHAAAGDAIVRGPVRDTAGRVRVAAGAAFTEALMDASDWFVEGVEFPWGAGVLFPCDEKCNPGEYKGTATGDGSCRACPAGTHNPEADSILARCTNCPAGTFSTGGASTCTPCPAGTSNPFSKGASCLACTPGFYSHEGARTCSPCPPGTYGDARGMPECTPCPVGTYQPDTASKTCVHCHAHTTTAGTGATNQSFCRCASNYQQDNDDHALVVQCILNERGSVVMGVNIAVVFVATALNIGLLVYFVPVIVKKYVMEAV